MSTALSSIERALPRLLADGCDVTFLPGDPPRTGCFAVYRLGGGHATSRAISASAAISTSAAVSASAAGAASPLEVPGDQTGDRPGVLPDELQVTVPAGTGVRRRIVAARLVPVGEALVALRDVDELAQASVSARVWSRVVLAALVLISRGRLFPTVSPAGFDSWRLGPLDLADEQLRRQLAAAFPPAAHAVALAGHRLLRLPTPEKLIAAAWDAVADTLPRTAAAGMVAAGPLYAAAAPQPAGHLRPWLVDAAGGLAGGATVALRVELDTAPDTTLASGADLAPAAPPDLAPGADLAPDARPGAALDGASVSDAASALDGAAASTDGSPPAAQAVVQLTSRVEPSLVVDAADLFRAPAAVLARFGADVETDLLLALRRGARVWAPLGELLRQRAPSVLALHDDDLADLLGDTAAELASAGIEVRWPASLLADGLSLRATAISAPGKVDGADEKGFGLDQLVEFRWEATLDGAALSAEEIDQLAEAKRGLVRLRGRWVTVDPRILRRLRDRRVRRLSAAEALGAVLAGTMPVDGELVPVVAQGPLGQLAAAVAEVGDQAGAGEVRFDPPDGLRAELRPYQQRGAAWLAAMSAAGVGGCLADDMGLGKTLQVIALHLQRRAEGLGPTLVVCPTTLVANWEREVRRFAPDVPVRRYHGPGRTLDDVDPAEMVLTSYGVARRDHAGLADVGFALVVADEAQHAKNPSTSTARALRAIPAQARVALTGTPVENRLSELWAILDWTTPGLLGPLERFTRSVAVPVERYRDPVATDRLARMVRPFVLRRRKTDPAIAPELPPRTVSDVPVPLTSEQVTLYEAEVREAMDKIRAKDGIERQGLVLRLLTVLKQICNHPAQYLHQPGPLPGRSGKFAALEELLGIMVAEGESVLVFSQFVECLSLVEARLADLQIPSLFLHGAVPAARRAAMVDAFQGGAAPVFLLSLKAGGVGLTLTRATHVVHVDRWWNPAVEDQATDRAHRIGQDRPVQVHRLIAEGTLEDRIAELIERKRQLAEAVVGGGEAWLASLSDDDLAALVELGRP